MLHPFLIFRQSDYLIQIVDIILHSKWETVQIQIKPTDLDLHCLQRRDTAGFSRTRVNGKCGLFDWMAKIISYSNTLHDYLIQIVDIILHSKWETVQIQIKPTDLDLHCLQGRDTAGFSRTRVNGKCGLFDWMAKIILHSNILHVKLKDRLQQTVYIRSDAAKRKVDQELYWLSIVRRPASVAQLDARPTSDQEVAGSTPAGSPTFFRDHEIYFTVILSLSLIQEGQLSVSGERMCTMLVNRLED